MLRFSIPALVLSNLAPVLGVLLFDWSVSAILLLYWAENAVIGLFNVLKMIRATGPQKKSFPTRLQAKKTPVFEKVFAILFFCVHFGIFTLAHGIFVFTLFGKDLPDPGSFLIAIVFLFVSHGLSYALHFIKKGEYKQVHYNDLFFQPYKRVIVMHITIIGAGWAMGLMGSPVWALLILIVLKTGFDIAAHRKEHKAIRKEPRTD